MRTLFTLVALGTVSLASAAQYSQATGSQTSGPNGYQAQQQYYQRSDQSYQRGDQGGYQQQPYGQNQGYYQQQGQPYYQGQQGYSQNGNYQGQEGYSDQNANSDQEILRKIHDNLSSSWFSKGYHDVSYDVSNGIVTLRGSVDTIDNKSKAEDSVRRILASDKSITKSQSLTRRQMTILNPNCKVQKKNSLKIMLPRVKIDKSMQKSAIS